MRTYYVLKGCPPVNDCNSEESFVFKKPISDSVHEVSRTPLGHLQIRGPVSAEQLSLCLLTNGLCCFRQPCRQHQALIELADQPDGIVFTASLANNIVSYVAFQKPDYPWWQNRCFPKLIELGSIETDPVWRKMGIGKALLDSIFNNKNFTYFEDFVVMAAHFVHSWDLTNTGLAPWAYRQFMIDFFSKYNFTTWETVDPEIREHPSNILLARVGKNLDEYEITHFTSCCLGTG
jgi:acetoin utilization protein AcuA